MPSGSSLFYFPVVVNDWKARMVAGQVFIWSVVILLFDLWWWLPILALGFWLRVGWGPRYSVAAKVASRWLVPLLGKEEKPIAGAPKRFAQTIGAVITSTAGILVLADAVEWARVFMAVLAGFAFLEAFVGFCAGCALYRLLARAGVFPPEICVNCVLGKSHSHG
ncbi:MAG: DUF4395 domain-containing protein [Fidelibacterota bacterium]